VPELVEEAEVVVLQQSKIRGGLSSRTISFRSQETSLGWLKSIVLEEAAVCRSIYLL